MSRLLLRTVLIIFLGVFAADAVSMRIVRSGEITEEVALTDLFKGGLALAQQRMNASTNVAATERILADLFEAPVSTIPGELPVQRVELNERGNPTFFLPVDRGILRIGPIPDPGRLDPADYHQEGRIAAVSVVFATALLIACLVFLVTIITLNRRMHEIEKSGIQVASLVVSREEGVVYLNNMEFKLTAAAMETLSVLAEARMDDDVLSGAEIESMVSGKPASDCEEAAGATRIKRLRDTLGNQMVSELLVKNIARRGYMLAIDKDVIKMI